MTAVSVPRSSTLVRTIMAICSERSMLPEAARHAELRWGLDSAPARWLRAAVSAGTTDSGSWPGSLVDAASAATEFMGLVAERSLVGRLASLRRTPVRVRTVAATSGAKGTWVGEARPAPLTRMSFAATPLEALKIVALVVLTNELARSADPQGERLITADLVRAVQATLDAAFLDPTNGGEEAVRPPSITFGVVPLAPAATFADDVAALIGSFAGDLDYAVFVGSPRLLARMTSASLPDVGGRGGTLAGFPALRSTQAADSLILLDPSSITYASDVLRLDSSSQGTLEMTDDPVGGEVEQVSLWQSDLSAIRATLPANWRASAGSVALVTYPGA